MQDETTNVLGQPMTMTRTKTLKQRLAEGPGSRELSDEFLLAMGWREDPEYSGALSPPDKLGSLDAYDRPSPSESVDDALAMARSIKDAYGVTLNLDFDQRADVSLYVGQSEKEGSAGGENPLPRAICLAILKC